VVANTFTSPFRAAMDAPCSKAMARGYSVSRYKADQSSASASRCPMRRFSADAICGLSGRIRGPVPRHHGRWWRRSASTCFNTAAYSPRPNTPAAATWPGQVSEAVKEMERLTAQCLVESEAAGGSGRLPGPREEVLVEGSTLRIPSQLMGRTAPTGSPSSRQIKQAGKKDPYQAGDR